MGRVSRRARSTRLWDFHGESLQVWTTGAECGEGLERQMQVMLVVVAAATDRLALDAGREGIRRRRTSGKASKCQWVARLIIKVEDLPYFVNGLRVIAARGGAEGSRSRHRKECTPVFPWPKLRTCMDQTQCAACPGYIHSRYVPAAAASVMCLARLVLGGRCGNPLHVCLASWTNRSRQISNRYPSPTSSVNA
jgi:hypothetical protein